MAGRLYVVATPIGNLGDISPRALETLRSVRLVAAEDTRRTGGLLRHFGIVTPLLSYHAHNRAARLPRLLLELGQGDVALATDAGTPVVSDPGEELVAAAAAAGHEVVAIPGPSAVVAALSVSGLPAVPFHVTGFLPRRATERRRALLEMAPWRGCVVLFEAPHRLRQTLADLLAVFGDRRVAVCCELTKLYESVYRASLSQAVEHYAAVEPRGEFTLVVEAPGGTSLRTGPPGSGPPEGTSQAPPVGDVEGRFAALLKLHGARRPALAALAAETGLPRKALYARLLARDRRPDPAPE